MSIRDAKNVDIPAIVGLLKLGYMQTPYALTAVEIDENVAKRLLVQCIQRHNFKGEGACWVQVAERQGEINGIIVGTLRRLYSISNALEASDLFWFGSDASRGTDMMALMAGMLAWARRSPAVAEVNIGATSLVGDPEKVGKLLKHAFGMRPYGSIFQLSFMKEAMVA